MFDNAILSSPFCYPFNFCMAKAIDNAELVILIAVPTLFNTELTFERPALICSVDIFTYCCSIFSRLTLSLSSWSDIILASDNFCFCAFFCPFLDVALLIFLVSLTIVPAASTFLFVLFKSIFPVGCPN